MGYRDFRITWRNQRFHVASGDWKNKQNSTRKKNRKQTELERKQKNIVLKNHVHWELKFISFDFLFFEFVIYILLPMTEGSGSCWHISLHRFHNSSNVIAIFHSSHLRKWSFEEGAQHKAIWCDREYINVFWCAWTDSHHHFDNDPMAWWTFSSALFAVHWTYRIAKWAMLRVHVSEWKASQATNAWEKIEFFSEERKIGKKIEWYTFELNEWKHECTQSTA